MNKLLLILFLACICTPTLAQDNFTVVIDAGHGGADTGAISNHVKEKDIVLDIAQKVGNQLAADSVNFVFTRNKDSYIPLHQRAKIANDAQADLFISIHTNAFTQPNVYGTEIYILGMHQSEENLAVAQKENAVILTEDNFEQHYEGFDPNSTESYIVFDLIQEQHLKHSVEIASLVQNELKYGAKRSSRGVRQAGFIVLKEVNCASILIEVGYISNPNESAYLNSTIGQEQIATAISEAITKFKSDFF